MKIDLKNPERNDISDAFIRKHLSSNIDPFALAKVLKYCVQQLVDTGKILPDDNHQVCVLAAVPFDPMSVYRVEYCMNRDDIFFHLNDGRVFNSRLELVC